MRYKSATEMIAAHGGAYRGTRGPALDVRPGKLTASGERHASEPPVPRRPPCQYLGEFLQTIKVSCRKDERAVPQHECRHPERTSRPSKRNPAKLIPPTALLGACAAFNGTQSQPCDLCRLWTAASAKS